MRHCHIIKSVKDNMADYKQSRENIFLMTANTLLENQYYNPNMYY
jgi:hypothetical protein